MTIATKPRLTFDDYLGICSRTDDLYELVRGELHQMNPPTLLHYRITKFLERQFDAEIDELGQPWEAFREIGQRTESNSSRLPDIAVVQQSEAEKLLRFTAVFEVPSLLLIEIVSPSSTTEDYGEKLKEYQALGVPEYWVVDPESKTDKRVTVYTLHNGSSQKQEFRGNQRILSETFKHLALTASQVLVGKK